MASVEAERKAKQRRQLVSKSQFDNTNNMFLVLPRKHKRRIANFIGNLYGNEAGKAENSYINDILR